MKKHRKLILAAVAGLLAFYLLPWSMYTQANVDDANTRQAAAAQSIEERRAEIEQARQLNRKKLEEQRAYLVEMLPSTPDLQATINRLVDLADATGVRWEQSSVSTPTATKSPTSTAPAAAGGAASESGTLSSFGLGVQISGQQEAVLDYLSEIRKTKPMVIVQNVLLSIDPPTVEALAANPVASPTMKATLELRTYAYRGLAPNGPSPGTASATAVTSATATSATTAAKAGP